MSTDRKLRCSFCHEAAHYMNPPRDDGPLPLVVRFCSWHTLMFYLGMAYVGEAAHTVER